MQIRSQAQDASQLDINLSDPSYQPKDTVSSITWTPSGKNSTFATSDWDSQIRIYKVKEDPHILVQEAQFNAESPCLSVKWHEDESRVFAGCTDGTVKMFDIASGGKYQEVGKNGGPVKSMYWVGSLGYLVTISFDKKMRYWDLRQQRPAAEFGFKEKPFCSDLLYPYLVVGLSNAKLCIVNLSITHPLPTYANSVLGTESQLTNIKITSSGYEEFAIGVSGNDGRSNLSKLVLRHGAVTSIPSILTFKVPDKSRNNVTMKYPVNCFGFHPHRGHQFMYTGKSDGRMFFWDSVKKGMTAHFDFKGNSVTQAEIDPSGKYMAYSLGYDWARGINGYMSQPSKVCVHVLKDKELEYQYQGNKNYPIMY